MRWHHIAVGTDVRAEIRNQPNIKGCHDATGVRRGGDFKDGLARMVDRGEMLVAILDPADRPPQTRGKPRDQKVFRIELSAHAEAAADVRLDEADRRLPHSQHPSKQRPIGVRNLGRTEHFERLPRTIKLGE